MIKKILFSLGSAIATFYLLLIISTPAQGAFTTGQNFCDLTPDGKATGAVTLNRNCVLYENVSGVVSGNLNLSSNATVTIHNKLVWSQGNSIIIPRGAKIIINSGGNIVQGNICVKDADNDGVADPVIITKDPETGTTLAENAPEKILNQIDSVATTSAQCPTDYKLRTTQNFPSLAYIDTNVNTQSSGGVAFQTTQDREFLNLGFQIGNIPSVLAAGADVTVDNTRNLIILGKLGVGFTTPASYLDVRVTDNVFPAATFNQAGTAPILVASVSGTNKMILTNAGNLGIGLTNPTKSLDIIGAKDQIAFGDAAGSERGYLGYDNTNNYGEFSIAAGGQTPRFKQFYSATATGPQFSFINDDGATETENFTILRNGNVGIANSTPGYKLDVTGNARFTTGIDLNNAGITNAGTISGITVTTANGDVTTTTGDLVSTIGIVSTGSTTRTNSLAGHLSVGKYATVSGGLNVWGNLGIGTSAPASKLTVVGTSSLQGATTVTTGGLGITSGDLTLSSGAISATGNLTSTTGILSTSGTGDNYIAGNLGIGTITPSVPLQVNKTSTGATVTQLLLTNLDSTLNSGVSLRFSPSSSPTTRYSSIDVTNDGNNRFDMAFITGNGATITEKMRVAYTGNVGIGTSTPTNAKLEVAGDVNITGSYKINNVALTNHNAVTLSAIGSTPNANGMTLSTQVLNLEPASASFGGVVTTGTQTFAGNKTFSGTLTTSTINGQTVSSAANFTGSITAATAITTGTQFAGNGSDLVTTPSFTWTGDLTTGMWRPAASTIAFSAGGSEKARIDSNGNLGIGRTQPSTTLDVGGVIKYEQYLVNAGDRLNSLPTNSIFQNSTDDSAGNYGMYFSFATGAWAPGTKMAIKSNGNVGIGTTTPTQTLDVTGGVRATNYYSSDNTAGATTTVSGLVYKNGLYTSGTLTGVVTGSGTASYIPKFNASTTAIGNSIMYDTGTNIGIGTTTPAQKLEVNGNIEYAVSGFVLQNYLATSSRAAGWFRFAESTSANVGNTGGIFEIRWAKSGIHGHVRFSVGNDYGWQNGTGVVILESSNYGTSAIDQIRIVTNPTYTANKTYIEANNTSATTTFSVYQLSGYGWSLISDIDGSIPANYVAHTVTANGLFAAGNTNGQFLVDKLGNVGIGTTTAPSAKLDVTGAITASSTITTGTQFAGNGSDLVTTPSHTWTGDLTTGMWRPAASTIAFSLGGSEKMRLTGGNLGIGNTQPTQVLDVTGGVRATNYYSSDSVAGATTTVSGLVYKNGLYTSGTLTGVVTGSGTASYIPKFNASTTALGNSVMYDDGSNIGIGTTTPGGKLQIISTLPATGNAYGLSVAATDDSTGTITTASRHGASITYSKTGVGTITSYNSDALGLFGNLNAGTTGSHYGAWSRQSLNGATVTNIYDFLADAQYGTTGTVSNRIGFMVGDFNKNAGQTFSGQQTGLYISNLTSGTTNFSIYSGTAPSYFNGNIGIGTTTPAQLLQVGAGSTNSVRRALQVGSSYGLNMQSYINNSATASLFQNAYIDGGAGISETYKWLTTHGSFGSRGITFSYGATGTGIKFYADSAAATADSSFTPTSRMIIQNDGNVGIAKTNPGSVLDVTGNITASTAITTGTQFVGNGSDLVTTPSFTWTGDLTTGMWRPAASTIAFSAGGSEKVRITSAGNIGIGTTSPSTILHLKSSFPLMTIEDTTNGNGPGINYSALSTNGTSRTASIRYFPSDTTGLSYMSIAPGGSSSFNVTDAGNVGIGNVDPISIMEIFNSSATGGPGVTVSNDTTGNAYMDFVNIDGTLRIGKERSSNGTLISGDISYAGVIGTLSSDPLQIATNNTVRLTIASDGNTGIGITNPATALHVSGKSTFGGQILGYGSGTFGIYALPAGASYGSVTAPSVAGSLYTYSSGTDFGIYQDGATTNYFSGNVGVGTATPSAQLEVGMATNPGAGMGINIHQYGGGNGRLGFLTSGTTKFTIGVPGSGVNASKLLIGTTALESNVRLAIDTSGNVGIGTTAPNTKLSVANKAYLTDSYDGGTGFAGTRPALFLDDSTTKASFQIVTGLYLGTQSAHSTNLLTDNTVRLTVLPTTGNVGIGTTTPAQKLSVAGSIRQTGCTTAGTLSANASGDIICTSDERLKNIFGFYQGGIDELMKINPIKFSYKDESFVHVGFSAQNVRSVLPEASALQDSGYYSLDTTSVTALTVNAIKEQQKEIDDLKKEIKELKEAIQELKK